MMQRSLDSHGNPKLILYKYRWVVLISYSLALVSLGMLGSTCTTSASLVKEIYGLSVFGANLANFSYFIMYTPSSLVAIAVFKRYGAKVSIIIGCVFYLIGAWLRLFVLFSGDSFTVFYVGSFVAAIGQPFLMMLTSKIASNWFGDKERAIASAIGLSGSAIGSAISFVLPQVVLR
jgi:MFS family permease